MADDFLVTIGVATILLTVLFFGELLLQFFGISIDSFRVGGGISTAHKQITDQTQVDA